MPDLTQYQGKPIREVLDEAAAKYHAGKAFYVEALSLYRLCAAQKQDPYQLGRLREKIWELEQCLGQHRVYHSAAGQDRFLHNALFAGQGSGQYVEIGGYNGWYGSNCYFFEKVLGWRGLIVEASPTLAAEIARFRSGEIIQAAISDHDGLAEFLEMKSGLTQMGGLRDSYPAQMLEQVRAYPGNEEALIQVNTLTLDSLLKASGITKVDYLSIDVEGAERSILSAFDFSRYDITALSVENNSASAQRSVRDIMEPAGYDLVEVIGSDEIYIRKGKAPPTG